MIRKIIGLILIFVFSGVRALSEIKDIGTPFIRNFTKSEYKAGSQNWDIAQNQKGFMLFANNEGLLIFDGEQWELYKMPNLSMVRSVYLNEKGEIYIGAYNEIGKMVTDATGKLIYQSLKDKIPQEYQNFADIWNILPYKNKIIYQAYNGAYVYEDGKPFTFIKAPVGFQQVFSVSGRLYFFDSGKGLFEYNGDSIVPIAGCDRLNGQEVRAIMPAGNMDDLIISTLDKGLFIFNGIELREWDVPVNDLLKKYQVYSATVLQDSYYAFGTIQEGVIIIDKNGKIIQHINKEKGLQNNTILKVSSDLTGNLWLGLDNGISYVIVNSPITFLQNPDGFGAGYTQLIYKNKLYLGTNQGVFVQDWIDGKTKKNPVMIPGTYGQAWSLEVQKGIILCGHNKGTFVIEGEKATLINQIDGCWKFHILKRYPDFLIGGTYEGLILFKWKEGSWKFIKRISGFNESFRIFEEDNEGDLWMSHGFKGIYRVRLNKTLDSVIYSRYYTEKEGLPSRFGINVFKINGRIIFTSNNSGIYEYSPESDRFVPSDYFNKLFSPIKNISLLKEDANSDIWYIANNKIGVFRIQEDFTFQHVTSTFTLLSGKFIKGFESIYPYSEDNLLVGIENGFAHYSPNNYSKSFPEFSTYITRSTAIYLDTTFYYGNNRLKEAGNNSLYKFPYKNNSFRFSYASPVYDNPGNIEFSYKLSGHDENWSEWSSDFSHEFSGLTEGKYSFMVKARNQFGIESSSDSLVFIVLSPWYKSIMAYIIYGILLVLLMVCLLWIENKRIVISNRKERLKQLLEYRKKERIYINQAVLVEKELITLKNEKLRIDMIQQDKELANQAMNLIRKNEFLTKIREELLNLKKTAKEEPVNVKVVSIISKINREVAHDKQREVFDLAFDEVHEKFMNKLKTQYPSLTPTELRLCAFLKMNISTKEIAPLMNISVRGVEICRYRIRKKLDIKRTTNLTSMLIDF